MQMRDTHKERKRVKRVFSGWGDGEVQLTPDNGRSMRLPEYMQLIGEHRFVLSPRGNGTQTRILHT